MLSDLRSTAYKTTGSHPITHPVIPKGDGIRYAVELTEIRSFLNRLSASDRDLFTKRATFSIKSCDQDERTVIIPLQSPLEIEGKTIYALRLKGVYPQAKEGLVLPYKEGNGFVSYLLPVTGKDIISSTTERTDFSAQGSMNLKRLKSEVLTALELGPNRTDMLLGFGTYEDLQYNGQPVGFSVYGMERKDDVRVLTYLKTKYGERMSHDREERPRWAIIPPTSTILAQNTGRLLREMHEIGLIHGYPHLGNYGILDPQQCRLLDLDTAVRMSTIPAEQRAAFIYLDLARVINDFMKDKYSILSKEEDHSIPNACFMPLLPHFLYGYFKGTQAQAFLKGIMRFVENNSFDSSLRAELFTMFGSLPEFGPGFRHGDDFTLVEPIIRLYSGEATALNLKTFTENKLFNLFYQAIELVADNS